ncbi:hypothetical protein AALB52_03695 [Lachnospiraceae bacterium 38-14]|uniref:hypothetical protein n=1 Tax=Roseburia sp. 1XD42-69 TaxID=2320088 RepID=UPI000EA1727F|nr:hypothetical protein [Roseburia sp. 1XD42-69]MCX4318562.1 hypothetical protein [Lachnospiraceae bacterium]RKJ68321.1 hypothetical protein D7Y06_02915 [Roseburia sp. 1XD42-69]
MKLKYYLRGIGIGVVVTTLIFMVSIALHKNETDNTPAEDKKNATVADMLETESESESEVSQEENQQLAQKPEQKSTEVNKPETKSSETNVPEEKSSETKPADKIEEDVKDDKKENDNPADNPSDTALDTGKVRFEIGGGEYSDVICKKLQQANLIDSAEEFNKFLIANDYDNLILPGVYAIPKGATYEEIAKLLTTKIEEN